jgi:hypothetical protein
MSTTVIMARDYRTAAEVAGRLGLGHDWLYPHSPELMRGMVIQRVIYVEGWLTATSITVETAEEVQRRLAPDAQVVTAGRGWLEPPAPVSAPFVETVAPDPIQDAARPSRARRGAPAWLWPLGVGFVGSVLGGAIYKAGQAWGWW